MFTVYLLNYNNEALALTDDVDAPQSHLFEDIGTMLEFIGTMQGTTGYRVNDDMEAVPFLVVSYRVLDKGTDITAEVPAALVRRAART